MSEGETPPPYQFSITRWLKGQAALVPILALTWTVAIMAADSRYMVKETPW